MNNHLVSALAAILLLASSLPARSDTGAMPVEKRFPSSVGEVVFKHQAHVQERGIACSECHHQINAKKLTTPHPEYFKSSAINCLACHNDSKDTQRNSYACSGCHRTNPLDIADETLSAKVVIHERCWKCHQVGRGAEASKGCGFCHSGKKT